MAKMRIAVDVNEGMVYATPDELRTMADTLEAHGVAAIEFMELAADENFDEGTLFPLKNEEFEDHG